MSILVQNLIKNYKQQKVVDIRHAEAKLGDTICVMGNNGAGKSTLFRLMLDLIVPDSGGVEIMGHQVASSEKWKGFVGSYLNEDFLIPFLTPEEFFYFVGSTGGLSKDKVDKRLEPFSSFFAGEILGQTKQIQLMSDGNKQKIGIASVLLLDPDIIIVDEPFTFLDPASRSFLKEYLKGLAEYKNKIILISSHDIHDSLDICTRIWAMKAGKFEFDTPNSTGVVDLLNDFFKLQNGKDLP